MSYKMILKIDININCNLVQHMFLQVVYKKWRGRDNVDVFTGGVPPSSFGLKLCIPKWASQILEGPWKLLPHFGLLSKMNILNRHCQTNSNLPNTPKASPWIPHMVGLNYLSYPHIPTIIGWTIAKRCIGNLSVRKVTHPSTIMLFGGLSLEFPWGPAYKALRIKACI